MRKQQHLEMMRLADSLQILFLFQILGSFCSLGWKNLWSFWLRNRQITGENGHFFFLRKKCTFWILIQFLHFSHIGKISLDQCFSNLNECMNNWEILLKCRLGSLGLGQCLEFCVSNKLPPKWCWVCYNIAGLRVVLWGAETWNLHGSLEPWELASSFWWEALIPVSDAVVLCSHYIVCSGVSFSQGS